MNIQIFIAPLLLAARAIAFLVAIYNFGLWRALGIGLIVSALTIRENGSSVIAPWRTRTLLGVAWAITCALFASFNAESNRVFGMDFTTMGFLTGFAIWPSSATTLSRTASPSDLQTFRLRGQKLLAVTWLLFTSVELLRGGYTYNHAKIFWTGIAGLFVTILVLVLAFRMPVIPKQAFVTLLLLLAGLPVADHFIRFVPELRDPVPDFEKYYSYEGAKKNPDVPVAWYLYSIRKWEEFRKKALIYDGPKELIIRFRPNSRGKLYYSDVEINSLGFRGREFSPHKTNTYRIVTLGESTTFGITLTPDHRPWPEVLEEIIHQRLKTEKPVEIINAGFPARSLPQNLYRLKHELLALEPDLIISYHGYNGFGMLDKALPPVSADHPPEYIRRPAKLMAAIEYNLKLAAYKRQNRMAVSSGSESDISNVMRTPYADAYRELIQITRTNHIKLVLANYSMAVNGSSDSDVVEFYRGPFPRVRAQIKANQGHSIIVETLARQSPDVSFVDTHPRLDGKHQFFIDLIHFNKLGEEQMAESFFAALKPILSSDESRRASANTPF